ncbi:MAG TPA: HEAT repeat domain-containing protein [Thermoanaerobaculia bacterium]|nr:HEAT repeat domain-containing protein [Thermoanaerobaculia bacterium]
MTDELSLTVASFARELALGWKKLLLYGPGHPARADVAARLQALLLGLVAPTGSLAFGVGKGALLDTSERVEGPAIGRFADALYERNVAVLRFTEGVEVAEVETFLGLLPRGRSQDDEEPLWERLQRHGVLHIQLEPVDFSAVVVSDELPQAGDGGEPGSSVYEAIVQRLLADERFAPGVGAGASATARSLAELVQVIRRVLERHGIEPGAAAPPEPGSSAAETLAALTRMVGGTAAATLREPATPAARPAMAHYLADLLGALPEGLRDGVLDAALRELVEDGDDAAAAAVRDLAGSLSAAQLVTSLRRLRAEQVAFTPRVIGVIEDLTLQAVPTLTTRQPLDDADAFTAGLRAVLAEDGFDRLRPGQQGTDRIALELRRRPPAPHPPEELMARLDSLDEGRVVVQLGQTLLDLVQRDIFDAGQSSAIVTRLGEVLQALLAGGRLSTAVRMLQALHTVAEGGGESRAVEQLAREALRSMVGPGTTAALVEALAELPDAPLPLVQQLIELLGDGLIRELLLALCEETDLGRRRHTFDLLASLGPALAPHATELLDDERWYVTRNMLALLRACGLPLPRATLRRGLEHADPRVRLEAVKCLGAVDGPIPPPLLQSILLGDDDKVAEATVAAIASHHVEEGIDPLLELLRGADPLGRHRRRRLKALAALGQLGQPRALPELAHFFRGWFAVINPDERRAAFTALAGYPPAARRSWLRKGLRCPDAEVRQICRRLERQEA